MASHGMARPMGSARLMIGRAAFLRLAFAAVVSSRLPLPEWFGEGSDFEWQESCGTFQNAMAGDWWRDEEPSIWKRIPEDAYTATMRHSFEAYVVGSDGVARRVV